jgi:hypothetical protein
VGFGLDENGIGWALIGLGGRRRLRSRGMIRLGFMVLQVLFRGCVRFWFQVFEEVGLNFFLEICYHNRGG